MLQNIEYKVVYSSGEVEPLEFFLDSLMESNTFDLGLGFFSSSGIRSLSLGFAYFIHRGGSMRILINDILSHVDKEAILKGYETSNPGDLIEEKIIKDITILYETLSKTDRHFFNCLSWMIASKKLEFKAIVPADNNIGIAHPKFGIFCDEAGNKVVFNGSVNFSENALFNNIETLSCYKSWTGELSENERVNYYSDLFKKYWEGKSSKAKIIPLDKVNTAIKERFPVASINQLYSEQIELIDALKAITLSPSLKFKLSEIEKKVKGETDEPKFPKGNKPFEYQEQALDKWNNAGRIGFFEMATGTGKTITSLNCALQLFREENGLNILILVPSISLADQWAIEAIAFNFKSIIIANSKNNNWAEEVINEINKSQILNSSFVIITTYTTFGMEKFQSVVNRLNENTLFIADEAHNFGTKRLIELHPYKFRRRIGLSATPKRHFDTDGTEAILRFFNSIENPTFKLDMEEAINRKFLCEYFYFPKIVTLASEELEEYKEISKKLLKYFDANTKRFAENPIVMALLLKRKRIIHKAENKKDCLRECLKDLKAAKSEIQYTLVYVPEGSDYNIDELDRKLIDNYSQIISNEFNLKQHQFIGDTENRDNILQRFAEGRLQVLTAMKCLDEGVDVKRTETAIFCSSTGNPRQFIQRRGRILRLHKEKKDATIFDMIVIPDISDLKSDANISMEKSILSSELKRVYEFASLSKNKYQSLKTLEDVAEQYDIDIFSTQIS